MKLFSKLALVAAIAVSVLAACTKGETGSTVAVTGVSLSETSLTFTVGENKAATLTATVAPSNASNQNVSWKIDNANVASITPNGATCSVTPGAEGTATITVTTEDGNKMATCAVTVNSATVKVDFVTLDEEAITIKAGEEFTLTATVFPENATDKSVTWESDDVEVATVSQTGVVTGVAPGNAVITVTTTDGGKTSTCDVKVGGLAKLQLDSAMFGCNAFMEYMTQGQNPDKYGFGSPDWFNPITYGVGDLYITPRVADLGLMANMWDGNLETNWHTNLDWGENHSSWGKRTLAADGTYHFLTLNLPDNYTKVEIKLTANTNEAGRRFGEKNEDTGEYEGGFVLLWSNDGDEFVPYDNGDDIIDGKVECPDYGSSVDVTLEATEAMPSIAAIRIRSQKENDWTGVACAFGIAELEVLAE